MTDPAAPASLDMEQLRRWIGREQEASDVVTSRLVAQWNGCFDDPACVPAGLESPPFPGLHWALTPETAPLASLEADGHVARGLFLPPVPLPDRLWAGGRLEHLEPLCVGDTVLRRSRIEDVSIKQGRSGTLCIVCVRHEYSTQRGPVLSERQDIVYRDRAADPGAAADGRAPGEAAQAGVPAVSWTLSADPVRLFRYSALTFNGHLIHYDRDYCRAHGYPGLLVHGPLQATLLLRLALTMGGGKLPAVFNYRATRPLFEDEAFSVNGAPDGTGLELWAATGNGITMRAQAFW